jgi:probable HAF family extracellular repeat protein
MNRKQTRLTCIIALLLIRGAVTPINLAGQNQGRQTKDQPRYAVTALGTFGGNVSTAAGVNNKGWVVGDSSFTGDNNEHAALWLNGVMIDLGTLGGPNSSIGFIGAHPNDAGLIIGNAQTDTLDPLGEYWGANFGCDVSGSNYSCEGWQYLFRGFSWKNGVITALPKLGGNNTAALGRANQQGEIAGTSEVNNPDPNCLAPQVLDWVPVLWEPNGGIRKLALFPGDSVGAASGINDQGQAVGGTGFCATPGTAAITHAVLWQNGNVTNLGSLGGAFNNFAVSINSRGQVIGLSDLPGDATSHAFLWQSGVMTDLGTLPGDFFSVAYEINDRGQVVGQSCDVNFNCRGFLWQGGIMTDLNTLIPPDSSFYLMAAWNINDAGVIVGGAYIASTGYAPGFVAIPCDQPHPDGSADDNEQQATGNDKSKIVLPENVREMLRRRGLPGLGR